MRLPAATFISAGLACALAAGPAAAASRQPARFAVAYTSKRALANAVEGRAQVVRRLGALHVAEVRSSAPRFATRVRQAPGIRSVQRLVERRSATEPALFDTTAFGQPFEWQFAAAHMDAVPTPVLRAASAVTIAVIDSGLDVSAPDLASKRPRTYNLHTGGTDVVDLNGHGTFVSSLAAGSGTNGDGIAGFGGDARLLMVKATDDDGELTDLDEANAVVYAVDHGARVINLSVGGPSTSYVERRGIQYAADHGVLVVAAAGNEYEQGNPVEYPAALLQPVGSDGRGGIGLAVGATTEDGNRASFSTTGSQLSLVAPGDNVFGAISAYSSPDEYPRSPLPGSSGGLYGFASGTSFASPEVAGVAALVMAANPLLRASDVATILKQSASGRGTWNPETGYGLLDAAAAVTAARGTTGLTVAAVRSGGLVTLKWYSPLAVSYRLSLRVDGGAARVLLARTTETSVSVRVRHGHRYAFTVTALDASGAAASASTYVVRG